jgi:chromosome segregation ATPase
MIQLQQLKEENAMLEEESQKLYEFLEDLSHKNELLSKENKSLKQIEGNEVSRAAGSVDNKEFIDTKYKLKAATLEIQDLTKQRDSLMYECADLKAELENLKGQVRTANTQAKMLQDQVDLYNSGDNELAMKSKKRLEEAQQEIDRWVAKAQELSVEKSSLVNELAQCREDSISLHETQAKMETEQVELRKLIEIIDEKNFNAQETISRLRSQIEVLEERSKDVSRREGQMAATEQRYQALVAELTANIASESKNANAKFTQLLDSARDKFGQQIRDKEEEIKDLSYKLAQLNLKADRLDLENRGLRDLQEKLATVQSTHDDKDEVILGLNKKIAELTSQNESISRKARDQELKRITHVVSPGTKDESYKRLEEELLKYKSQVEVIKLEQNRLQETIKRKDRAIAFLEEDRVNSMKRTTELHSLSNNEYLRDIEVKDKELAEVRKKFAEFKSDVETKMIKHEQLEEQLLLHSKNTIRNYEQKIQKLAQENDDLRHKYSLLESMVS